MLSFSIFVGPLANATTAAVTAATESAEDSFHMTFGELAVSVTALLLSVTTVVLVWVSLRLERATLMAANLEMARVSTHANDAMADVSMNANDAMADVAKAAAAHHHTPTSKH